METSIAIIGNRRNLLLTIGWIGAFIGCTLSMAESAQFLMVNQHALHAIIPVGCFAISSLVLVNLWKSRDRMQPRLAVLATICILSLFVVSLYTLAAVKGSYDSLKDLPWPTPSFSTTFVSLLVPLTILGLLTDSFSRIANYASKRD